VLAERAGAAMLGACGVKAALDIDWHEASTRGHALGKVLFALKAVQASMAA
jgi:hypothetical protein